MTSPVNSANPERKNEPAERFDSGKRRVDLLPVEPLEDIADVFTFGAKKYGDRNWEKGMSWSRVYGSTLRHLWAWWRGEDLDQESKLPHLAHAGCNILFALYYNRHHHEYDDRPRMRVGRADLKRGA